MRPTEFVPADSIRCLTYRYGLRRLVKPYRAIRDPPEGTRSKASPLRRPAGSEGALGGNDQEGMEIWERGWSIEGLKKSSSFP